MSDSRNTFSVQKVTIPLVGAVVALFTVGSMIAGHLLWIASIQAASSTAEARSITKDSEHDQRLDRQATLILEMKTILTDIKADAASTRTMVEVMMKQNESRR